MCGITGVINRSGGDRIDDASLRCAADAIAHRGPDGEGFWTDRGVGLAHRRLSIIDLAGGAQPISNEDGAIWVTFNGEIYNYRELKSALEKRGHRFRTSSDTEVLVHLYEDHGDDLVRHLRGMFAFAIWDARRQRLLLARDRVGLKPLYYCRTAKRFIFGSEIKALLAWPGVDRSIDAESLEDYLAFGVVPGDRSIFASIRKLPPGSVLGVAARDLSGEPKRYWTLHDEPDVELSVPDWEEAIRARFLETVRAHLIADVPVGAFLSGGLDSSAVTAAIVQLGGGDVHTFSIGFEEESFSELPHARKVAEQLGTRHVEFTVTPDAVQSLDDLVTYFDEPFADPSAIPTMYVSRLARQHVKVVLSGDGGDEAFGGYARYAHDLQEAAWRSRLPKALRESLLGPLSRVWPKADWLPRGLRLKSLLQNLAANDAEAYANTISIMRRPLRRTLLHADVRSQLNGHSSERRVIDGFGSPGRDALRGMIAADVDMLLPDDFLTKVDRASMSVGLEVRPPLVDHEFLELAARIPSALKIRNGETKWLFKNVAARWLPHDIVWRKKQGFDMPIDSWLRGPLRDACRSAIRDSTAPLAAYVDQTVVNKLFTNHQRHIGRHGQILWALTVLGEWMRRYCSPPSAVAAS